MKFGKITLKLVLLLLFISQNVLAQWLYSPVSQNLTNQNSSKAKTTATPLTLPFFDDFSLAKKGQPDLNLWLPKGGTLVNNFYPINHPSINVATLDGLRSNGFPYVPSNQSSEGSTDSLISQVIDLSKSVLQDSLFLTFYWQNSGLGERPDPNDSLRLQFRTNGDIWKTVWVKKSEDFLDLSKPFIIKTKTGKDSTAYPIVNNLAGKDTVFTQELIRIRANLYLHPNFQFRFESFGQQSGQFDAWHIDYVYLNKKTIKTKFDFRDDYYRFISDVAVRGASNNASKNPINLLEKFSSMPMKQFLMNKTNEFSKKLSVDFTYLGSLIDKPEYSFNIRNSTDKLFYEGKIFSESIGFDNNKKPITIPFYNQVWILPNTTDFFKNLIPDNAKKAILKTTFSAKTSSSFVEQVPEINFTRNDTLSTTTVLDDYYAYDDGSAEMGVYVPKGFARVAAKFTANEADSVSAIRIKFAPSLRSIAGQEITIQIMDADKDGNPGKILLQKNVAIQYSDTSKVDFIDKSEGFVNFDMTKDVRQVVGDTSRILTSPISVPKIFFIGYAQSSDNEPVIIGLDRNNPQFGTNYFYNIGNGWSQNNDIKGNAVKYVKGSLMMRPVMGGKVIEKTKWTKLVLANESEIIGNTLVISPNPSDGVIRWNESSLKDAEILDLSGKIIFQKHTENQEIDASHLNSGLYLLKLSNQKNTFVRKIIIK
jgi:Secretion system C-terminal sorting domain